MTRIAEWHRSKVVKEVCYDVVCTCGKALPSSLGRQARKSECDTEELKCRREDRAWLRNEPFRVIKIIL